MMIFTVYDVKAELYLQPFFSPTEQTALRSFRAAASDQDHDFWKFSEDYTLFFIGEWNEVDGVLDMAIAMKPLGNALQFKSLEIVAAERAGETG